MRTPIAPPPAAAGTIAPPPAAAGTIASPHLLTPGTFAAPPPLTAEELIGGAAASLPSALDLAPELRAVALRPAPTALAETVLPPFDDEVAEQRAHRRRLAVSAAALGGTVAAAWGAITAALG